MNVSTLLYKLCQACNVFTFNLEKRGCTVAVYQVIDIKKMSDSPCLLFFELTAEEYLRFDYADFMLVMLRLLPLFKEHVEYPPDTTLQKKSAWLCKLDDI